MPFSLPSRLYPIVDTLGDPHRSHLDLARAILAAGAPLLQLRIKDEPTGRCVEIARAIKAEADRQRALFIVNDRTDIAKLVDASGVHLGQDDLPVSAARQLLGTGKVIGLSTHNLAQVQGATQQGIADYIGLGPIYPTGSKSNPDPILGLGGLHEARQHSSLPIVAIGGITSNTAHEVLRTGAQAVAMIAAIVRAVDVETTVRALLHTLR